VVALMASPLVVPPRSPRKSPPVCTFLWHPAANGGGRSVGVGNVQLGNALAVGDVTQHHHQGSGCPGVLILQATKCRSPNDRRLAGRGDSAGGRPRGKASRAVSYGVLDGSRSVDRRVLSHEEILSGR